MEVPQKLKIEPPCDLAIPMRTRSKEMELLSQRHSCAPMFVAALFTIVKTWKQPKCPSTDEWIKQMSS